MIALLLLVAALADTPTSTGRLPWPWRLLPDAREDVRCVLDATLDARGRPTSPVFVACPEVLRPLATRKLLAWRYEGSAGEVRRVTLRWRAPGDVAPPPSPQRWWWREGMACSAQVVVDAGGEAGVHEVRRLSEGCAVQVTTPPLAPRGPRRTPSLCPVTFVADASGRVDVVEVFRCPASAAAAARDTVRASTWRGPEAVPWAWSVVVQLDRP